MECYTFKEFMDKHELGETSVALSLYSHLRDIGALMVIEEEYVDQDYIKDYSRFYSRSFQEKGRMTHRFHFFSCKFDRDTFFNWLDNPSNLYSYFGKEENDENPLSSYYKGFIIRKPISNENNQPLIGRTCLTPKESETGFYVQHKVHVNLFGLSLRIKTLPFIMQDEAVGACASAALWTCNYPLSYVYHNPPPLCLSEVTEIATAHPGIGRTFPSDGLNIEQIIKYFKSQGYDTEIIYGAKKTDALPVAIRSFVDANMPILVSLDFYKKTEDTIEGRKPQYEDAGGHAVVISGYETNKEKTEIESIYVHDDQIGPYTSVRRNENFFVWENDWKREYDLILVNYLIVPVSPKMRFTFNRAYAEYETALKNAKLADENSRVSLSVRQIYEYKEKLIDEKFWWSHMPLKDGDNEKIEKRVLLSMNLPKYVWVIRTYRGGKKVVDAIYDGTEVYSKPLCSIHFT